MTNRMAETPMIGIAPFITLNTGYLKDKSNIAAGTTYPPSPGTHNGWGVMTAAIANERNASLMSASLKKAVSIHAKAIATAPKPAHVRYKSTSNPFSIVGYSMR